MAPAVGRPAAGAALWLPPRTRLDLTAGGPERLAWIVLAISWLLWAGHQLFQERTSTPWPVAGHHLFRLSAWQVLFFTAMAMRYHRDRLAASAVVFGLLVLLVDELRKPLQRALGWLPLPLGQGALDAYPPMWWHVLPGNHDSDYRQRDVAESLRLNDSALHERAIGDEP